MHPSGNGRYPGDKARRQAELAATTGKPKPKELGPPPKGMSPKARVIWKLLNDENPHLTRTHRPWVKGAVDVAVRVERMNATFEREAALAEKEGRDPGRVYVNEDGKKLDLYVALLATEEKFLRFLTALAISPTALSKLQSEVGVGNTPESREAQDMAARRKSYFGNGRPEKRV